MRSLITYPAVLFITCFTVLVTACTTGRMIETNLYFGLSKPGGGRVTDEEWSRFKEEKISAVFKEGSTVYPATGNWFDPEANKLITEPTYVVVCFYKNSKDISIRIDSLRLLYKMLYQQQSVLRVDKKVKAAF